MRLTDTLNLYAALGKSDGEGGAGHLPSMPSNAEAKTEVSKPISATLGIFVNRVCSPSWQLCRTGLRF